MINHRLTMTWALTCGLMTCVAGCASMGFGSGCHDPACTDPFCPNGNLNVRARSLAFGCTDSDCQDPDCDGCATEGRAKKSAASWCGENGCGDESCVRCEPKAGAKTYAGEAGKHDIDKHEARKLEADKHADKHADKETSKHTKVDRTECASTDPAGVSAGDGSGCTDPACEGCGAGTANRSVVRGGCDDPDCTTCRAAGGKNSGRCDGGSNRGHCGNPNCRDCRGIVRAGHHYPSSVPRELDKTTLPRHLIEPPDILLIEAIDNMRLESSTLQAGESLIVQVGQTVPIDPTEGRVDQLFKIINGLYSINVDGYLDLGPEYGKVLLEGLTLAEARTRMDQHLKRTLKKPKLYLAYGDTRTRQLISGQHLVRPDGTVSMGIYGSVYVTGMTIEEAQHEIQQHLQKHIHRPQVAVDILAYNSKFYYVVADGGGAGEQVIKLPCTGNETVLDAVANIRGLPTVASKGEIWIARPAPAGTSGDQILRVDWNEIVQGGTTDTNYQLLPGDRLYVKADDLIIFDTFVAKLTAPWERLFGFTLLGNGTVRALQRGRNSQGGGGFGF